MNYLLFPSIMTLGFVLFGLYRKRKLSFHYYFWMFCFFFIIEWFCISKAHASFKPNAQIEINLFPKIECLSDQDHAYYKKKLKFHNDNAKRCFNDAKQMCWYLPSRDDVDYAELCFKAVMTNSFAPNITAKATGALLILVTEYACICRKEWNEMQTKIHWANYHAEMTEFYKDLLNNH